MKTLEIVETRPALYFTGLRRSPEQNALVGHFLWETHWRGKNGLNSISQWNYPVVIQLKDIRNLSGENADGLIRAVFSDALAGIERTFKDSLRDARNGIAATGRFEQIPNPEFNPALPAADDFDDEYDVWNPSTVNGPEIMAEIEAFCFSSVEGQPFDLKRELKECGRL